MGHGYNKTSYKCEKNTVLFLLLNCYCKQKLPLGGDDFQLHLGDSLKTKIRIKYYKEISLLTRRSSEQIIIHLIKDLIANPFKMNCAETSLK